MLVRNLFFSAALLTASTVSAATEVATIKEEFYFPRQPASLTYTATMLGTQARLSVLIDPLADEFDYAIAPDVTPQIAAFTQGLIAHNPVYLNVSGYETGPGGPYPYANISSVAGYDVEGGYYIRDEDTGRGDPQEDYYVILHIYGTTSSAVPEPSALLLLCQCSWVLIRRRR